MKRLALLGMAVFGLAAGIAACGNSPVEPGPTTAAFESAPAFGKSGGSYAFAPTCESAVYPTSLCVPSNRPALCAALKDGGSFNYAVVGRPATETFETVSGGSLETVRIPRPYGLPPTVLTFRITSSQIAAICSNVS